MSDFDTNLENYSNGDLMTLFDVEPHNSPDEVKKKSDDYLDALENEHPEIVEFVKNAQQKLLETTKKQLFDHQGNHFFSDFLSKCWSSCGPLGAARWPWEALGAIFVERMLGPNFPRAQGVNGLGGSPIPLIL